MSKSCKREASGFSGAAVETGGAAACCSWDPPYLEQVVAAGTRQTGEKKVQESATESACSNRSPKRAQLNAAPLTIRGSFFSR